jgi:hypothetical protein
MAVCGHCFICGWKASCDEDDEAVRWQCMPCSKLSGSSPAAVGPIHTHFICRRCHDTLVGDVINSAVDDLVELIRMRNENGPR